MARSKAVVETKNASRYLQQLCKHWSHKFTVDFTPTGGRIEFGDGRVVELQANEASLSVEVDSPDLQRLEQVVADHIVRFAFREELTFVWTPAG
ncbi:DUF2218 domain-containing protein [Pseudaminobacter salicylatoxidans]|uniref:DUF2218 domain-containing protein n=1 Tax=Pseudaminobacter salicylatoxidans TaxID=93369 RepID=UPI0002D68701|nr:DUF2218 domain-containing protein [Pseudaminobacter salicylatoxidans]